MAMMFNLGPASLQHLALLQMEKHGADRYPTVNQQMLKLVEEVGELAKAINKAGPKWNTIGPERDRVRSELSDVALSLGNLATKLGVPCLEDLVAAHVAADDRNFQRSKGQRT